MVVVQEIHLGGNLAQSMKGNLHSRDPVPGTLLSAVRK